MYVKIIKLNNDWTNAINTARRTRRLPDIEGPVSYEKQRLYLLREHSPLRTLTVQWQWENIPYWVSVQISRHKVGIEHFVTSQRTDITGIERDELPQSALVNHECIANYQAIINISKERLCGRATEGVRIAWAIFLQKLASRGEKALFHCCVKKCVYRGFCPEGDDSCGYCETDSFAKEIKAYRGEE